jgi:hypothetical protein
MQKSVFILVISLITFHLVAEAQISKTGYKGYSWGINKSAIKGLKDCSPSYLDKEMQNCSASDSLFLGKYPFEYLNYRFYKQQFMEVNFDFSRAEMGNIISKLTIDFGSPIVKEKKNPESEGFTAYEWIVGDSRVLIIDKGTHLPIWLNISSIKIKGMVTNTSELDIEKILFGEL